MLQMVGEMPGENHSSGLTYKSHAETAAHKPTQRGTGRQTDTHIHTGRYREKMAPLTGLPHPSQMGQPSPGTFTWKHGVFKELPLPPAHPSRHLSTRVSDAHGVSPNPAPRPAGPHSH